MSAALRLVDVKKRYGKRWALSGISFEVPEGCITGFIGPNGAGKTTTFGLVSGLLQPDGGNLDVLGGGPFDPSRRGGELGLVPQDAELPPHATVLALLRYWGELGGLSARGARHAALDALSLVSLADRADSRIAELSHGMRRRVSVAQALLGRPKLVLLDEPTAGLDPERVVEMRDTLLRAREQTGCAMLVSSHLLSDLQSISDRVVLIEKGLVRTEGSLDEVTGRSRFVRYRLARMPAAASLSGQLDGLRFDVIDELYLRVYVPAGGDVERTNAKVLATLLALSAGVLEVHAGDSLEDAYMARNSPGPSAA